LAERQAATQEWDMLRKLILAALIAVSFGGVAATFATPAAAAVSAYLTFFDDGHGE
jgi:hypothetical protein